MRGPKNGVRNLFVKGPAAWVELAYKDALRAIEYNGFLWGRKTKEEQAEHRAQQKLEAMIDFL